MGTDDSLPDGEDWVRVVGWGPFRLPGEKRRRAESREYAKRVMEARRRTEAVPPPETAQHIPDMMATGEDFIQKYYNHRLVSREDGKPVGPRIGGGEVVPPKKPRHKCDQPYPWTTGLSDGSVWRCDCGRRWILRRGDEAARWNRKLWPWPR